MASVIPSSLPTILPSVPEGEFRLPPLPQIDTKKKRKVNSKHLPTLGSRRATSRTTVQKKPTALGVAYENFTLSLKKQGSAAEKDKDAKGDSSKKRGGLVDLIAMIKVIEEECLAECDEAKQDQVDQDPFIKCKNTIEGILEDTRTLVEERRQILETRGTTYESIAMRSSITENIGYLKQKFQDLGDIYAQQYRQRKTLKLSEEELEARHQQLNELLKQIEVVHRMSKFTTRTTPSGASAPEPRGSRVLFADLASQPSRSHKGDPGINSAVTDAPEQLTEEDEVVLKRWKERDREFDEQIAHIGDAIDRIADIALEIGHQAEKQDEIVEGLGQRTDAAAAEIQLLDSKLKKFLKEQQGSNFCCKMILLLIMLLLFCFVFSTVYARYIKKA